jgi:hypothetical protein
MATLDIPQRFNRARHKGHDTAVDGAAFLIRHVCDTLGLVDLSDQEVLCPHIDEQAAMLFDLRLVSWKAEAP